jgi:hypothetical protein
MRHSTVGLALLLGCSLALNVVLVVRRPAPETPPPRPVIAHVCAPSTSRAAAPEFPPQPVPMPPAPAGSPAPRRESVRNIRRALLSGEAGADLDHDARAALLEFHRLAAAPSRDPRAFCDFFREFCAAALEGGGAELRPAQETMLSEIFQEAARAYAGLERLPAAERGLEELAVEASAVRRLLDLLDPSQREALTSSPLGPLVSSAGVNAAAVSRGDAEEAIVAEWGGRYGLQPAQQEQARAAARAYLDALERSGALAPASLFLERPLRPEVYEVRLGALREQMAALKILEPSLTPAQLERLRARTPRELVVYRSGP